MRPSLIYFFLMGMFVGVSSGQSRLIFPRISSEEGTLTGIAVLNPSAAAVVVTLTAYDTEGQLISSDLENPREITIEAGRQFADVTSSVFGILDPETVGWIEATSPASDLTGFFLFLDFPDITLFDGADLPQTANHLVFPEVRLTEGFSTELNLVNTGLTTAVLQLTLEAGADLTLRSETLEIRARGVLRVNAADVFAGVAPAGMGALPDAAIISVASTEPLAGFAFVRQAAGDLLGLNAVPRSDQLNTLYFPQLAVGENIIRTELSLSNLSTEDTLVTLTAHQEGGVPFGPEEVSTNPVSLALEAGQVVRLDMAETFGFIGSAVRQGWLEVVSAHPSLQGALSYRLPGTGSLAAVATSRQGNRQAAFSHLATDAGFFTGLAMLNSASLAADVRIVAISQGGSILGTATRTLAPGERISQLLGTELIPRAAGQSGGAVYVRSSLPIFLTSLFGQVEGSGVLANIPAQPVPTPYRPDQGIPQSRVNPPLAAVEPGGSLSFMLQMGGNGMPLWKVNGLAMGNSTVGTITAAGIFQAPEASPVRLPVSITAEVGDQAASASVDVVSRQVLAAGLGTVQSVAYLEGLERLYVAELGVAAPSTAEVLQGTTASVILDVTGGNRNPIRNIPGEDVAKILAYRQANGRESLLAAGRGTGQIYRLGVEEPFDLQIIASGLNAPGAMALDPGSGDLIVAEANQLSRIPAARLSMESTSLQGISTAAGSLVLQGIAPQGVAVDTCSGNIFFSDGAQRSIRRLDRGSGEVTTVVQLNDPTQLLGILRSGASCPDGFHLFVAEPSAGQVTRLVPAEGLTSLYVFTTGVQDVAFLSAGDRVGSAGVLVAEQMDTGGQVELLGSPEIYQMEAINPPHPSSCIGQVEIPDPDLDSAIRQALGIGTNDPILCNLAESLLDLNAENMEISDLVGLEAFINLQTLSLFGNQVSDISPLAALTNLRLLLLDRNEITQLAPLAGLTGLLELSIDRNQFSDIAALAGLTNLRSLFIDFNQITDILPLVANLGLGVGDFIALEGNPLSAGDCVNINALVARGAFVDIADTLCP